MEAYLYDHGSIHALYLVASWNLFAGQSNVTHRSPLGHGCAKESYYVQWSVQIEKYVSLVSKKC